MAKYEEHAALYAHIEQLQRDVIEAAKAFYVERQEPDSGHSIEELTFWQAVRALLAAERDE